MTARLLQFAAQALSGRVVGRSAGSDVEVRVAGLGELLRGYLTIGLVLRIDGKTIMFC